MKALSFNEFWPRFEWVLEEMQLGMAFFEGYITAIDGGRVLPGILELIGLSHFHGFDTTVWENGTNPSLMEKDHTPAEFVRCFEEGGLLTLGFYYERTVPEFELEQKLNVERGPASLDLGMICTREQFLESDDPKAAVRAAVEEFRFLKRLFNGDALFLGGDASDYPISAKEYPQAWLRIE